MAACKSPSNVPAPASATAGKLDVNEFEAILKKRATISFKQFPPGMP
jgi:hypothetical protein